VLEAYNTFDCHVLYHIITFIRSYFTPS
jgi:hypothetical protein